MKILAFLVAFLFCVAFVLAFIGSRADGLSVKEAFSKLSSTIAVVALLIGAYGGASVTLSSIASTSEYKFKTVTNNEVQYFNECKKKMGIIFVRKIQAKKLLWKIFGKSIKKIQNAMQNEQGLKRL